MSQTQLPATHLPSSLLLCEALGFSPQLLLDDIINVANNAVQDGVNGMEEFLLKWVEERGVKGKGKGKEKGVGWEADEDLTQDIEQGLVSFQTLLEHHTDIAFDFFEAWSLRNIFFIPPELIGSLALPHHEGLQLDGGTDIVKKERELMEELEELRKQLDTQRRLSRLLTRAIQTSKQSHLRAQSRYEHVASLLPPDSYNLTSSDPTIPVSPLAKLTSIPSSLMGLYNTVSTLPSLDGSLLPSHVEGRINRASGTGYEKSAYVGWAVGRLVDGRRAKEGDEKMDEMVDVQGERKVSSGDTKKELGNGIVDRLETVAGYVGGAVDVRGAVEAFGKLN